MRLWNCKKRTPIGIDVGRKRIKAVQLRADGSSYVVAAAVSIARAEGSDAATLSAEETTRLGAVLHRQGFTGNQIVLCCPPGKAVQSLLQLPPVRAAIPLESLIRNELCAAQRLDATQVQVAHWVVPTPSRGGKGTFVMATALAHADAQSIIDSLAAEKLDVIAIDVDALALARGCELAMPGGDSPVAIVDLGWSSATIVIVLAGSVVFQRPLPEVSFGALVTRVAQQTRLKGDLIARLLSRTDPALSVPAPRDAAMNPSTVEARLPELSADVAEHLHDAVRAHVEALASELQQSIGYVMQSYPDQSQARVRLVGGGTALPGIDRELQNVLGCECVTAAPMNTSPQMTLASGLALYEAAA